MAASVALLVLDVYSESGRGSSSETLVEHEGNWVLGLLAAPILIAAAPLFSPSAYRKGLALAAAVAGTVFALVTGFTIGLLYVPMAIFLIMSAVQLTGERA